jgi:hypothetical protein
MRGLLTQLRLLFGDVQLRREVWKLRVGVVGCDELWYLLAQVQG